MTSAAPQRPPRPREVTFGGTQAVVGGALALVLVIGAAQQLYSHKMEDMLKQLVTDPHATQLGLTLADARTLTKVALMVMGVMGVTSSILGIYVLRRHRSSRLVLTVLGGLVAALTLFAGPTGWVVTLYIGGSLLMLWSKAARAWFSDAPPTSGAGPYPPTLPPSRW